MIRESARRFFHTSWFWLESDTPAELPAGHVISPLDPALRCVVQPDGTLAVAPDPYVPAQATHTAIERLIKQRVEAVIAALPDNANFVSSADVADEADEFDAEDDLRQADKLAVMIENGPAQPVASAGLAPIVGTNAVATCVAVLSRVQRQNNQWILGCTHLTADDMATFADALTALHNLLVAMAAEATIDAGPVRLYAIGGRAGYAGIYREYSMLLAAAEELAHQYAQQPHAPQLAGARLPANEHDYALAVYITSTEVRYTSVQSDTDSGSD